MIATVIGCVACPEQSEGSLRSGFCSLFGNPPRLFKFDIVFISPLRGWDESFMQYFLYFHLNSFKESDY